MKMAKGLFAKKCARKIVNCYRVFAELREALADGRALAPGHKHLAQPVLVVQFLFKASDFATEVTPKEGALVKMKLKELSEDPQQRELCFLTNTQSWTIK